MGQGRGLGRGRAKTGDPEGSRVEGVPEDLEVLFEELGVGVVGTEGLGCNLNSTLKQG